METQEFGEDYAAEQMRRSRHSLRKAIKRFYIQNILKHVAGPTIDFGCGAGQLLARLPSGSVGLELNPHLVGALRSEGLNAELYDPEDKFELAGFPTNFYKTLVMAHVLEHFEDAKGVLRTLLRTCNRIGISHVIIVVPGEVGFASDKTHKTFVNRQYLQTNRLFELEGFVARKVNYFPLNAEVVGKYFIFHELMVVYDRAGIRKD
jgi:SAM-dependent methyltransferase